MAGVHGLEHVERFPAAALANDDSIRPHPKGVLEQVAHSDLTFPLDIGRTRFEPYDVFLLELKLG
jgi:hypothetical protein